MPISNEEFELLGEPRMTMAQLWLEEQWIEDTTCPDCGEDKILDDDLCINCYEGEHKLSGDQEIIQAWRDLEVAGDPPPEVEDAIRREQVRLAEETINDRG